MRDSFEKFGNQKKLSLISNEFFLVEFIEESPLVLTTVGMASKLVKHIYPKRVRKEIQLLKQTIQSNLEDQTSFLGSQTRIDSVTHHKSMVDTSFVSKSRLEDSELKSVTASFTTKQ